MRNHHILPRNISREGKRERQIELSQLDFIVKQPSDIKTAISLHSTTGRNSIQISSIDETSKKRLLTMASPPKQVFLFDMTRHRSHLLFRYLNTHPDVRPFWHPFLPAFLFGPQNITHSINDSRPVSDRTDGEGNAYDRTNTYAEVTQKFLNAVQEAAEQVCD